MKTFEEKYTAWLDGALDGEDLKAFEREHPNLQREKDEMLKLSNLLKQSFRQTELAHPDFFNSQIIQQIERETKVAKYWWKRSTLGLPRFAWGGALSVGAAAALCFGFLVPHPDSSKSSYMAKVLQTKTRDPKVTATVDSQKDMTMIKLHGMEAVPADKDLNQ